MKMGYFTNKVVVITGATSGIGMALALQIADKNVHLILAARRVNELDEVKQACMLKGSRCTPLFIDLSSPDSIRDFTREVTGLVDKVDVLINNAGISQRSLAAETTLEVDRTIMEVNFFGQVGLTKSLWGLINRSNQANIVIISSVTGTFGFPLRSAYAASKHALEGFFESWLLENENPKIKFTTISPGRIYTNISYSALKGDGTAHRQLDKGQAKGISAEVCAQKIIHGIARNRRKVYIAHQEMVLVLLRKIIPPFFFSLVKKLKLS